MSGRRTNPARRLGDRHGAALLLRHPVAHTPREDRAADAQRPDSLPGELHRVRHAVHRAGEVTERTER